MVEEVAMMEGKCLNFWFYVQGVGCPNLDTIGRVIDFDQYISITNSSIFGQTLLIN